VLLGGSQAHFQVGNAGPQPLAFWTSCPDGGLRHDTQKLPESPKTGKITCKTVNGNQSPDKTDFSDARVLADLERVGYLPRVWIAPQQLRELRT